MVPFFVFLSRAQEKGDHNMGAGALPCAHGPSRAASCERSERGDNKLDKQALSDVARPSAFEANPTI